MISRKNLTVLTFIAIFAVVSGACSKADNKNTATNSQTNTATTNSSANTSTPAQPTSTGSSPTDAYKAAYTARKNKDIEGLKKLMSKDIIEFLTMMGEADQKDKKSLDAMLKDLCERPQAATPDARNEKINGDKATIEYLDETGQWQTMDFVKEDGAWKLTIDKADAPPAEKPASNSPAGNKKP
ncbi:MAG: hypothetical protein QM785_20335 [Pyrinomonadaceae bacterium]